MQLFFAFQSPPPPSFASNTTSSPPPLSTSFHRRPPLPGIPPPDAALFHDRPWTQLTIVRSDDLGHAAGVGIGAELNCYTLALPGEAVAGEELELELVHHLVYEVLDNAVDEAQAGYATKIDVVLHDENSVSVMGNGRGIPTDIHPQTKKSCVETVLTLMHAGDKFGGSTSSYCVAGGLHGVGLSVVNALSEALDVTVCHDGKEYRQSYSRGKPLTTLSSTTLHGESSTCQGTCIRFWPDKEIFTTTIDFDFNTISSRIRELAFLNPDLTITLTKEEDDAQVQHNEYCYAGGLVEYVA